MTDGMVIIIFHFPTFRELGFSRVTVYRNFSPTKRNRNRRGGLYFSVQRFVGTTINICKQTFIHALNVLVSTRSPRRNEFLQCFNVTLTLESVGNS